jgi:tetratricopeptide (TPR) repeat protein
MADGLIEGAGAASRDEILCWMRDMQKIPLTDPNYFFGNLYPNRLIVCIGNNVPAISQKTGIQRTFKAMQPGGGSALPPAIEFDGLAHRAVHGGFFVYGGQRSNLAQAQARAEKVLAFSYFMAQLYDQAEKGFSKKLAEEPEDAASLWGLGMVYTMKKDYDAAINAFHRSIAGSGGSSKPAIEALARYKLGNCYDLKGMRNQAIREYQTVVRMDVNFYGAVDSSKKYLEKPYVETEGK